MVEINRDACIGCGQCIGDCIAENLHLKEGKAEVSGAWPLCCCLSMQRRIHPGI